MRLQYASDLHLESWIHSTFEEILDIRAPVLCLLGDICPVPHTHLHAFFEWCSERWETILWIPGNLEIWSSGAKSVEDGVAAMRAAVAPFRNVEVLYKDRFLSEDGVFVLSCPLWNIPRPDMMLQVRGRIWAKADPPPTDKDLFLREYQANVRWLNGQLRDTHIPTVVLTHYAPFPWMQEEEWIQDKDKSIRSVETEKLVRPPVVAWVFGHCHVAVQEFSTWADATGREFSTLLTSNPRGLPGRPSPDYRKDAVVRIDPALYEFL